MKIEIFFKQPHCPYLSFITKLMSKTVIIIYGCCLIIGCQSEITSKPESKPDQSEITSKPESKPELFWYQPYSSLKECWCEWQGCDYKEDCMYEKGYNLFKREDLPQGISFQRVYEDSSYLHSSDGWRLKNYGLAGKNYTAIKREYVENNPNRPDSIKDAILAGRVIKGMTIEEVNIILNLNKCWSNWSRVLRDSEGYEVYELGSGLSRRYFTFLEGKLVEWVEY